MNRHPLVPQRLVRRQILGIRHGQSIGRTDHALRGRGFTTLPLGDEEWQIRVTNEFLGWIGELEKRSKAQVVDAVDRLAEGGPGLGRPLVDRLEGSEIHNLKELRPGSA
ncbi:type II toxin-antitoxin system RelE/ParE family toxin [Actinomadura geliboluensis]|uniref:type II toxin-antitoxin system RelE/ParE family toxin n=1 Tax=Actinomadura geliboluensis TaxID=882440 RepID=UPI001F1142CC|nr:type II toxin-antitoxin system RelE/ParE family toxin [Actinomadura geliboluensis]